MTKEVSGGAGNIIYALKAAVFSFAATFTVLFICALAAVYTAATDSVISLMTAASSCVCVMWGGFMLSRRIGSRGLLSGAMLGLIYVIVLYLIGCIALGRMTFGIAPVLTGIICIGCGAIGGIIGVNAKTGRRRR